jgi:hypothetical protein
MFAVPSVMNTKSVRAVRIDGAARARSIITEICGTTPMTGVAVEDIPVADRRPRFWIQHRGIVIPIQGRKP